MPFCSRCGSPVEESDKFCARCGNPLPPSPPPSSTPVALVNIAMRKLYGVVATLGVGFILATYAASLILGPYLLFTTPQGLEIALGEGWWIYFLAITETVILPVDVNVGVFFLLFWAAFVGCVLISLRGPTPHRSFLATVRGSFSRPILKTTTSNPLFLLPISASMLFLALIVLDLLQTSAGVSQGSIDFPNPYLGLVAVSEASVLEELNFRVFPLGILVFLKILSATRTRSDLPQKFRYKLAFLALVYPEGAKEGAGMKTTTGAGWWRGIGRVEWAFLLLSALWFGLAHWASGSGWDVGKVSTAFLFGVWAGVLYLVYGLWASILLHWSFNYHSTVLVIGSELSPTLDGLLTLYVLAILALGVTGWIALTTTLLRKAKRKIRRTTQTNPQSPPLPPANRGTV